MIRKLFLVLLGLNLISASISFACAWINYMHTEGFEAKQAKFIVVILSISISLYNLLFSLLALFNQLPSIRNNPILRVLSFVSVPLLTFTLIATQFVSATDPDKNTMEFFALAGTPLFYMTGLFLFRTRIKNILAEAD